MQAGRAAPGLFCGGEEENGCAVGVFAGPVYGGEKVFAGCFVGWERPEAFEQVFRRLEQVVRSWCWVRWNERGIRGSEKWIRGNERGVYGWILREKTGVYRQNGQKCENASA